jgi:uroporphyrinogen decarboxylase
MLATHDPCSLQPWRRYRTDGVILFSDILTPLPGMNVQFNIKEGTGPDLPAYRTAAQVATMTLLDPAKATPFVGATLRNLKKDIGGESTLLGFLGLPFTLATYMIEGGSSKDFYNTKMLMYKDPDTVHKLLQKLEENMVAYGLYQIEQGAQVLQVFDSWAATLSPTDYDTFALPYQRRVIARLKAARPEVPIILYIAKSGALLEKMGTSGADIVSLDWTSDLRQARDRMEAAGAGPELVLQGNLDPLLLLSDKDTIKQRTEDILRQSGGRRHVMNLGHGIDPRTPEENVDFFVETVRKFKPTPT